MPDNDSDNNIAARPFAVTFSVEDSVNSGVLSTVTNPVQSKSWRANPKVSWNVPTGWTPSTGWIPSTPFRIPITPLIQSIVNTAGWTSGNRITIRILPPANITSGRVARKNPSLVVTYVTPCAKRFVENRDHRGRTQRPPDLGDYHPPSVDVAGDYFPSPGQFCNEKVETQRRRIFSKYSKAPPLEKVRLLAISECIIENVHAYATPEYIEMMSKHHVRREYFVPICQNITELP